MATFGISRELVVTLKYYYEKSVAETTLKYLFFKVPLEFPWIFEFQVILKLFPQHGRLGTLAYSEPELYWKACQYIL